MCKIREIRGGEYGCYEYGTLAVEVCLYFNIAFVFNVFPGPLSGEKLLGHFHVNRQAPILMAHRCPLRIIKYCSATNKKKKSAKHNLYSKGERNSVRYILSMSQSSFSYLRLHLHHIRVHLPRHLPLFRHLCLPRPLYLLSIFISVFNLKKGCAANSSVCTVHLLLIKKSPINIPVQSGNGNTTKKIRRQNKNK